MIRLLDWFLHYYPNALLLYVLIRIFGWEKDRRTEKALSALAAFALMTLTDALKLQAFKRFSGEPYYVLLQLALIFCLLASAQVFGVLMLGGWGWYKLTVIIMWWFFDETVRSIAIAAVPPSADGAIPAGRMLIVTDVLLTLCSAFLIRLHLNFTIHVSRWIMVVLIGLSLFSEFYVYQQCLPVGNPMIWSLVYNVLNMFFIYWCLIMLIRKMQELIDRDFQQRVRDLELEQARSHYQEMRKLRHEYKNNVLMLKILAERGDPDALKAYLDEFTEEYDRRLEFVQSGNDTVDAILNHEVQKAESRGIECRVQAAVPPSVGIRMSDLASVLFNAIDNAIEAAAGTETPRIDVRMKMKQHFLLLSVSNSAPEHVLDSNPHLHTTKADASFHGNGIRVMRDIAARCGGDVELSQEGGTVQLSVMLQENAPPG